MEIQIRLFATLTKYLPPGADGRTARLTVPDGATVAQVLDQVGIPPGLSKLLMVDGVHRDRETVLEPGCVLSVFPPIAGG